MPKTKENFGDDIINGPDSPARIAYYYKNGLYLNITHRCPTACEFCIKFSWKGKYRGFNLSLEKEPSAQAILEACGDPSSYSRIVFCGYGESTFRMKEMEDVAVALREKGAKNIRLNTVGLGNLINGRNIVPDLARFLDEISISLNTIDRQEWLKIHRPLPPYREKGYESVIDFIKECSKTKLNTFVTAVDAPGLDKARFENFVENLGARPRIRPYLDGYQSE